MTKNLSSGTTVVAFLLGLPFCSGAMGQEAPIASVDDVNLAEIFQSSQLADAYFSDLRAQVADANSRGNAAEIERTLVQLGRMAYDYASMDGVPDPIRTGARREALNSLLAAADLALTDGRIRYTEKVAALATELDDRAALDRAFQKYLRNYSDGKGRYLALNDYGAALAVFQDHNAADRYFLDAIAMRPEPEYGMEARMRYATHLVQTGRAAEALSILDQFDASMRANRPFMAIYRQHLMHSLGVDTTEVDKEGRRFATVFSARSVLDHCRS